MSRWDINDLLWLFGLFSCLGINFFQFIYLRLDYVRIDSYLNIIGLITQNKSKIMIKTMWTPLEFEFLCGPSPIERDNFKH